MIYAFLTWQKLFCKGYLSNEVVRYQNLGVDGGLPADGEEFAL